VREDDNGSALLEFVWLAVLLLVPLIYVVLGAVTVQRSAFALTAAARDAARAYATSGSDAEGERRAELAVSLAMHDEGVNWQPAGRVVTCGDCDYAPGSMFSVDLVTTVKLPFVPRWLCPQRCAPGISVSAHHRERLDCFAGVGEGASC